MSSRTLVTTTLLISMFIIIGCGSGNPVLNYTNSPIVTSSAGKNLENVRRVIILAGTRIGWQMQETSANHIIATIFRDGHMAKVDINYTAAAFNITYKDSSNLKYDGINIHKTYNTWVKRLHRNIRSGIANM